MIGAVMIPAAATLAEAYAKAVAVRSMVLPATPPAAMRAVCAFEELSLAHCEQVEIPTDQLLHAGMYVRTIQMEPGVVLTGALMKLATVLIIYGRVKMLAGDGWVELSGYNVIAASAGCKQVFEAIERTWITMAFPTAAKTAEQAEAEFTDDAERLQSRRVECNSVRVTGE